MNKTEYYKSLSELKVGDEVVVFDRIFQIKRITKLFIVIQYGNMDRKFRIKDGTEAGDFPRINQPRIIPITDELRARIKLKNDKDLMKAVFSRTIDNLNQDAVTEMTARLRVYEK